MLCLFFPFPLQSVFLMHSETLRVCVCTRCIPLLLLSSPLSRVAAWSVHKLVKHNVEVHRLAIFRQSSHNVSHGLSREPHRRHVLHDFLDGHPIRAHLGLLPWRWARSWWWWPARGSRGSSRNRGSSIRWWRRQNRSWKTGVSVGRWLRGWWRSRRRLRV